MTKTSDNKPKVGAPSLQPEIAIARAFTIFMIPFYYESETEGSPFLTGNLWKKESEKVSNEGEDGDVLYSYIMDFLQGQMKNDSSIHDHLSIYNMNVDKESGWYRNFWDPFVNHPHVAYIPFGKNEAKEDVFNQVKFKMLSSDEKGFNAPHLFIYDKAKIGILTFCIELAERKKTMANLKLLNYHLHKIYKPMCRCDCPNIGINEKRIFSDDKERQTEEAKLNEVRTFIAPHDKLEEYSPYGSFTWNMRGLCDLLLGNMEHQLFSNIRCHIFTYCQIDDSEKECLTKDDLMPDLIRLSRCVSDKYLLPFDDIAKSDAVLQCFENIYYASSVEGTAIIAVAKKSNKGFISQMDGNVRLRYLWIYMLAVIQRYTLLNMNRQLMVIASANNESMLWELINTIKDVKIRCYYTNVSPYTQQDQFYQLCCRNLNIKEAFDEIDEKTNALNTTISHDMQKRLDLLSLGLSAFAVISIACDLFTLIQNAHHGGQAWARALLWASPVAILCIFILHFALKRHRT